MAPWDSAEQMWEAFRSAHGLSEDATYSSWHFCDNQVDADALAQLVVVGTKRATAGALRSYEAEGEPLPQVGDYSLIAEWGGRPHAIIRTTSVEIVPFGQVGLDFAATEGEGDGSLAYWRSAHWAAFSRELAPLGLKPTEDMLVVCERFDLVFV